MSKINETIVMMAEQKEQFEINGKKFQIIEVKEAEQQPDYSHLVGKFVRATVNAADDYTEGKWYPVKDVQGFSMSIETNKQYPLMWGLNIGTVQNYFDLSNPSDTNPDENKVWEKANEAMWKYGGGQRVASMDFLGSPDGFQDHFDKQWKHIRAYLFLSKFADLCNEGRVVDWTDYNSTKYIVGYDTGMLSLNNYSTLKRHIAFLDIEARDYSLKVHEQIWKDYWGIE